MRLFFSSCKAFSRAKFFGAISLVLFLGACASTSRVPYQELSYTKNPPLDVPFSSIRLDTSQVMEKTVGIENVTFLDLLRPWSKEVLNPIGLDTSCLVLALEEAGVSECPPSAESPHPKGQDKYVGRLSIKCFALGKGNKRTVNISVNGTSYVPKNASPVQRRQWILSLFEEMINRLTKQLWRQVPYLWQA